MQTIKRAVLAIAAVGATLVVGAAPAVAQTPAVVPPGNGGIGPTTAQQCEAYLSGLGYVVGSGVKNACAAGALPLGIGWYYCNGALIGLGVRSDHASTACSVAGS